MRIPSNRSLALASTSQPVRRSAPLPQRRDLADAMQTLRTARVALGGGDGPRSPVEWARSHLGDSIAHMKSVKAGIYNSSPHVPGQPVDYGDPMLNHFADWTPTTSSCANYVCDALLSSGRPPLTRSVTGVASLRDALITTPGTPWRELKPTPAQAKDPAWWAANARPGDAVMLSTRDGGAWGHAVMYTGLGAGGEPMFIGANNVSAQKDANNKYLEFGGSQKITEVPLSALVQWIGPGYFGVTSVCHDTGGAAAAAGTGPKAIEQKAALAQTTGGNGAPLGPTFGGGWAAWAGLTAKGATAAQYFDLTQIFGLHAGVANPHHNLCGELAVGSALGLTPQDALKLFATIPGGMATLMDPKKGTSDTMLASFFKAAGWSAETRVRNVKGNEDPTITADEMQRDLAGGKAIILQVNATSSGLAAFKDSPGFPHWVRVVGVTQGPNGTSVQVYNPYNNRVETYSWAQLDAAWSNSGLNGGYRAVIGTPP